MNKFRFLLPVGAAFFAITIAWTARPDQNSDLVWFEMDANRQPVNSCGGVRGDLPPVICTGGETLCALAFSISEGEVSLNSGSTTLYHLNPGVDLETDYNLAAYKP